MIVDPLNKTFSIVMLKGHMKFMGLIKE